MPRTPGTRHNIFHTLTVINLLLLLSTATGCSTIAVQDNTAADSSTGLVVQYIFIFMLITISGSHFVFANAICRRGIKRLDDQVAAGEIDLKNKARQMKHLDPKLWRVMGVIGATLGFLELIWRIVSDL